CPDASTVIQAFMPDWKLARVGVEAVLSLNGWFASPAGSGASNTPLWGTAWKFTCERTARHAVLSVVDVRSAAAPELLSSGIAAVAPPFWPAWQLLHAPAASIS